MSTWTVVRVMVSGGLALLVLAGCASGPGDGPSGELSERVPADPLFQRKYTAPSGRAWDFRIGGGYEPSER
jgi:hypothetical protein